MNTSLRSLFLQHVAQTSDIPPMLEVAKAQGVYLYDKDGKQYLDLISGIAVSNVGHCHPEVVAAIQQQAETYMHVMVYGEFVQSPQVKYAESLCALLPPTLNSVYFVNSGNEANDGAIKLAKRVTGRTEIIYFENAYHGSGQGCLSVMGSEFFKQAYRPLLPGTKRIRYNVMEDLELITCRTAAVIFETIQGESGALVPNQEYVKALRAKCDYTGTLLIMDEIQCGFGRSGKLFAFEHFDVIPDILTIAKGMGGGLPIGAFIASRELMNSLSHDPFLGHITTFGGNAVCCAAAHASLNVLLSEKLIEQVTSKHNRFKDKLKHSHIGSIQGIGLMLAVELAESISVIDMVNQCYAAGLITDWFLFNDRAIRFAPPLIITDEQIDFACEQIIGILDKL
ncbi:MAG: aspartate aminotransferase family protein [Flavobacteriales bacterium]